MNEYEAVVWQEGNESERVSLGIFKTRGEANAAVKELEQEQPNVVVRSTVLVWASAL